VGQGDDVTVQRPDLGVVVPVYNGERWLRAALESLQEQTLADWEAVVVDDGSTDDTLRLAQEITAGDTRFRVVSQPNAGVAVARNVGLAQLAEGIRFVAFLDADDRYEPAALGLLRATLDARPEAVGAYCLARYVDAEGVPILVGRHEAVQRDRRRVVGRRVVSADAEVDLAFDSLIVSNAIWPAAVALLRRGDLLALGGADPSFQVQEDWELYLRLSRRGPFAFVPHTLVDYRRHDSNATVASTQHAFHQDRMWHKAWVSRDNTAAQRRSVHRAWRWLQVRQAREHLRQLPTAVRRRDTRTVARVLAGVGLCLASIVLPGPPVVGARVSAWMHTLVYARQSWDAVHP